MLRKIVEINEAKCSGCGLCAKACKEAAIVIEQGKARLIREDYCDGLGNCLPACPMDAITITEREAAPFDETAVKDNLAREKHARASVQGGCAASGVQVLSPRGMTGGGASMLRQWPVQIKLASVDAPYFGDAHLLVAADCTAYAYGSFHQDFLRGRVCLIGCPKLDGVDYAEKLGEIFARHSVQSVTVVRMEVPCCGGMARAVQRAAAQSGRQLPVRVVTIATDGRIIP